MSTKDKSQQENESFWPFKPRWSIVATVGLLISILLTVALIRKMLGWPNDKSENIVLIGILLISLLPIFLSMLDLLIKHRGTFEYKGIKLDFSVVESIGTFGFEVPVNIEDEYQIDQSLQDDIVGALDALSQVSENDVVVIDIGQTPWWETRLLIVLVY